MAGIGIFQSAIIARMPMLSGTADLILLVLVSWTVQERVGHPWIWGISAGVVASLVSALPQGILFVAYLSIAGLTYFARRIIWRAPLLTTMAVVFIGSLIVNGSSVIGILIMSGYVEFWEAFNIIILPGILLNLLLTVPVYVLVREITRRVYPGDASIPAESEI